MQKALKKLKDEPTNMPITEWKCSQCSKITEDLVLSYKNIPTSLNCECGGSCSRKISRVSSFDTTKKIVYPFISGSPIELNYAEKKKYLKENNLQEAGDSVGGSKDNWASDHIKKQKQAVKKEQAVHRREFLKKELKLS